MFNKEWFGIFFNNRVKLYSLAEGVKAKVYLRAVPRMVDGRKYLSLQQLKMDFSVKDIRMGVENVHNGNSVLRTYIFKYLLTTSAKKLIK